MQHNFLVFQKKNASGGKQWTLTLLRVRWGMVILQWTGIISSEDWKYSKLLEKHLKPG